MTEKKIVKDGPPKSASAPPFIKADDVSLGKDHRTLHRWIVPLSKRVIAEDWGLEKQPQNLIFNLCF
jgi:hypothetical protein